MSGKTNNMINYATREGIDDIELVYRHLQQNNIDKAQRLALDIITNNPERDDILVSLSRISSQTKNLDQSIKFLFEANKVRPNNIQIMLELASALLESSGEYDESENAATGLIKQVLERKPDSVPARLLFAKFYLKNTDIDNAESYIKSALDIDPKSFEAYFLWAQLLYRVGDFERSFNKLENALTYDEESAKAYFLLSKIVTFEDINDKYFKTMIKIFKHRKLSSEDKGSITNAIAKVYEDLGIEDKSQAYYRLSAKYIRKSLNYQPEKDLKMLKAIAKSYTESFLTNLKSKCINQDFVSKYKPVFVCALETSSKLVLVNKLLDNYQSQYVGNNNAFNKLIPGSKYSKDYQGFIQHLSKAAEIDLEHIFKCYMNINFVDHENTSEFLIDDSQDNIFNLGLIKTLCPEARFIILKPSDEDWSECFKTKFESKYYNFSYSKRDIKAYANAYNTLIKHWLTLDTDNSITFIEDLDNCDFSKLI
jgi:cytochrome c-type biogenesis protein CcmH/NrfG